MVQSFARFGSEVHLVEAVDKILTKEDPEASKIIPEQLERDGAEVLCCDKDLKLAPVDGGGVCSARAGWRRATRANTNADSNNPFTMMPVARRVVDLRPPQPPISGSTVRGRADLAQENESEV